MKRGLVACLLLQLFSLRNSLEARIHREGEGGKKILWAVMVHGGAHVIVGKKIAEKLEEKGHKVTLLVYDSDKVDTTSLQRYIQVRGRNDDGSIWLADKNGKFLHDYAAIWSDHKIEFQTSILLFLQTPEFMCRAVLDNPKVIERISREKFDFAIVDYTSNGCIYALMHHFNIPYASVILSKGFDQTVFPQNPATVGVLLSRLNEPSNVFERAFNLVAFVISRLGTEIHHWVSSFHIWRRIPDSPSLGQLIDNSEHIFILHDYFVDETKRFPADVSLVGCYTCRPPKPLETDLQTFMDEAKSVVIISFGYSYTKSGIFPDRLWNGIIGMARNLSDRGVKVLMTFPGEFGECPGNMRVESWLSMMDVLGHPKTRVFISQCGGGSVMESLYNGVPIVGIPLFGDHFEMCSLLRRRGLGHTLNKANVDAHILSEMIVNILKDRDLENRVKNVSSFMKDISTISFQKIAERIDHIAHHNSHTDGFRLHTLSYHVWEVNDGSEDTKANTKDTLGSKGQSAPCADALLAAASVQLWERDTLRDCEQHWVVCIRLLQVPGGEAGERIGGSGAHVIVAKQIAEKLEEKGHNVTLLVYDSDKVNTTSLQRYIGVRGRNDDGSLLLADETGKFIYPYAAIWSESKLEIYNSLLLFLHTPEFMCRAVLDDPNVIERISREKFDLAIVDYTSNACIYALMHRLNIPYVSVFLSKGFDQTAFSQNPATVGVLLSRLSEPSNMFERAFNLAAFIVSRLGTEIYHWVGSFHIWRRFPDSPSLGQLIDNSEHIFILHDYFVDETKRFPDDVSLVGCYTCRPPKPLETDLQTFMDEAKSVVIISFGYSYTKPGIFPDRLWNGIIGMARNLSDRGVKVLMTFPGEFGELPGNMRVEPWLSMMDVLGHPKTRVFISQCGGGSVMESLYNGVPIVGIPLFGDHFEMCSLLRRRGLGHTLNKANVDAHVLSKMIVNILKDRDLENRVKNVSSFMKDISIISFQEIAERIDHIAHHNSHTDGFRLDAVSYHVWEVYMLDQLL
ncbi:unnamed protein product, partial [Darwinula stevensoni]